MERLPTLEFPMAVAAGAAAATHDSPRTFAADFSFGPPAPAAAAVTSQQGGFALRGASRSSQQAAGEKRPAEAAGWEAGGAAAKRACREGSGSGSAPAG